jgi:hypothetical protein
MEVRVSCVTGHLEDLLELILSFNVYYLEYILDKGIIIVEYLFSYAIRGL